MQQVERIGLGAGARHQGPDPCGVELVVGEREAVAAGQRLQPRRGGAEVPAQPGDVALQRRPAGLGRVVGPEGVDQAVGGDHPALREREQREDGAAFGAAHVDDRPGHGQAQRTEHVHRDRNRGHPHTVPGTGRIGQCQRPQTVRRRRVGR